MADRAALKVLAAQREALESEMEAIVERLNAPGQPGVKGPLVDAEVRDTVSVAAPCVLPRDLRRRVCLTGPTCTMRALVVQGFPRADIDVHAVRTDRHRLAGALAAGPVWGWRSPPSDMRALCACAPAVLRTDHERVTRQLESGLHALLSPSRTSELPTPSAPREAPKRARLADEAAAAAHHPSGGERPFAVADEVSLGSPAHEAGLLVGDRVIALGGATTLRDAPEVVARAAQAGETLTVRVVRDGAERSLQLAPRTWAGRGVLGCHLKPS